MRFFRLTMTTGLVIACMLCGVPALAQAPAPADLAAGRKLFVEALADEEHGRFADALAKYKRVLVIRDTPNVRYRIGSSLERMGKIVQALESFGAAVRVGTASGSAADAEVVRAAQERIDTLSAKVVHVTLRLPTPPPSGAEVRVDGEAVPPTKLVDLPLDPGSHAVSATAPGAAPFRTSVDLTEGARVEIPIVLPATADPMPPPPPPATSSPTAPHPYRTAGIVTAAAGGALLVGGVIVLAVRSGTIGDLESACPNGACPASRRDELQSAHDRAQAAGPLGVALVATGVAAVATGFVLVLLGGSEKSARLVPVPIANGGLLTFGREL